MGEQTERENCEPNQTADVPPRDAKLKRKEYEHALRDLQSELCSLQDWVKETGHSAR